MCTAPSIGHRLMNEGLTFIVCLGAKGGFFLFWFFSHKTEQVGGSHLCPAVNNLKVTFQIN